MRLENIVKQLQKEGYEVYAGEFDFKPFKMCDGTALVDLVNGEPVPTSATYKQVITQIKENRSHILTDKTLNRNLKL